MTGVFVESASNPAAPPRCRSPRMNTVLSVIVITHNSRGELGPCLSVLKESNVAGIELVVVDSGSAPSQVPGSEVAEIVISLQNVGYGTAANYGISRASSEWVAILNPDVRVSSVELLRLRSIAEECGLAMISGEILSDSGLPQPHFNSLPTPPWGRRETVARAVGPGVWAAAALQGSVLVAERRALEVVGGFDEEYFLYFEEIDLADRLRRAGFEVGWTDRVRAVHRNEASSENVEPAWRLAQRLRGKALFFRQRYGRMAAMLILVRDALRAMSKLGITSWRSYLQGLVADPRSGIEGRPSPFRASHG